MKTLMPFEALVVRYVHDGRSGEFLNIGVVLLSVNHSFAGVRFLDKWTRITNAFPGAEYVLLRQVAKAFERRAAEWNAEASGQGNLFDSVRSIDSFVRNVLDVSDASIQFSPPICGVTRDPSETLRELFQLYAHEDNSEPLKRDDGEVWTEFTRHLKDANLVKRLTAHTLAAKHYEHRFDHAWKNGVWNIAQPISLDLVESRAIRDKAALWVGKVLTLHPRSAQDTNFYFVVGMPRDGSLLKVREAARDAVAILRENLQDEADVIEENDSAELAGKIARDLSAHHGAAD